jgi:hypothetical protein
VAGKGKRELAVQEQQKEDILNSIVEGDSLNKVCRRRGMPSRGTVYNWMAVDRHFAAQYAYATMIRRMQMIELVLDTAESIPKGTSGAELMRIRTQIDTYKWAAGSMGSSADGLGTGSGFLPAPKEEQKRKLADQLEAALEKGMSLEQVIEGLRK